MSLSAIKSEICQLLNLSAITATEAKQLPEAKGIETNWSKTETWQALLDNIKAERQLEQATTDTIDNNDTSTTEQVEPATEACRTITINPVLVADSFIDLILGNRVWFYNQYKINDIKFPTNNKAVLYSELVQDNFVLTKSNTYKLTFKSVNHSLEEVNQLFSFDWLKLSNYHYSLVENSLISDQEKKSDTTEYRSVQLPNQLNKANQLLLNIANFKQQNTGDKLSNNIKTFKDWTRTMYLELPDSKLDDFLTGLKRNHAGQSIDTVREAFKLNTKIVGRMLNHNSSVGAMRFCNEPHIDIKGRLQPKKAVLLTRNEEKYTPIVDSYISITVAELFKILDIQVDMSSYVRYAGFCGYWKLVIISHLLNRTQYQLSNPWMVLVSSHLKMHNSTGGYVLVEEIDSKRQNNKIRLNNNTAFNVTTVNSGKVQSSYLEANKLKVIDRIEVKQTNDLLGSNSKPKSVKNTNKGAKSANYIKLAETNNYEIRLFYVEHDSINKPHVSFKEVLANICYVEKQTSISTVIGHIWIKTTKQKNNILYFAKVQSLRDKAVLFANEDIERKILSYKREVEKLSEKIKELRAKREDGKAVTINLLNQNPSNKNEWETVSNAAKEEDSLAKELRGLINDKVRYELDIKSYDLNLPFEVINSLYHLGINLLTDGIVPRELDWSRIFNTLDLEIPILKDNAIVVKGIK